MPHLEDYLVNVPARPLVTNVIAHLSSLGAYLHSPSSTVVDGRRQYKVFLTVGPIMVDGVGSDWGEAVRAALFWFDEERCETPLQPWDVGCVIDAHGHELGGEA